MASHIEDRYARKQEKKNKVNEFNMEISRKGLKRGWIGEDGVKTFSPRKTLGKNVPKRYVKSMRNVNIKDYEVDWGDECFES